MRASSDPMPNEAPVIRAVLRSGVEFIFHLTIYFRKKGGSADPPKTPAKMPWPQDFSSPLNQRRLYLINRMPRGCGLQLFVDVMDVLYALGFQPLAESLCPLFGVDGNAVLPGRASAEHAVELHARFSGEFEGLAEFCVADAG